jgi:hypothetical protein
MARRAVMLLALAALACVPAAADAGAVERGSRVAKKLRLKPFPSCAGLVRYGRRHAGRGPGAGPAPPSSGTTLPETPPLRPREGDPVAPPPQTAPAEGDAGAGAEGDSGTNVQEAGVDEPDIVKTAGGRIFAIAGNRLHAVDASGPGLLDSLDLEGWSHQLLLSGERLLVISQAAPIGVGTPGPDGRRVAPEQGLPYDDVTVLTEVDVSDPAAMKVLRTERIRGVHVSSRLTGRSARVVVWSRPRAVLEPALRSRLRGWLPRRALRSGATGRRRLRQAVPCRRVLRPASFSGTDTLTVLTIDLSKGLPAVDSDAILSGGQIAYASKDSLYVATPRWTPQPDGVASEPPDGARTLIHRFDISDPDSTSYRASGQVPGYLLNQFSLSEHRGVLRVASTEGPEWLPLASGAEPESRVTTLDQRDGALVKLGHAGGLGRGERIYAVRFIGDEGYVVTFRETDPLYTLDLSTPAEPRVIGELKLLGFSAYLHPIADDLLLGVGQDATERGGRLGTQLSLFDVSDLGRPRRLHRLTIGESSSDVEYDHHAFLWWPPAKRAVLPVHSYAFRGPYDVPFSGAIGFGVDRAAGIAEVGRAAHDADPERYPWPVMRSFVVGGRLFTLSDTGLEANSLADLTEEAWLPLPGA